MSTITDVHDIAYPAALWLTEDTTSGGEIPLGDIESVIDLELALYAIDHQGGTTAGWYVCGLDADGYRVRLPTIDA